MGIHPHPPASLRSEFRKFRKEFALLVKELLSSITLHPLFENFEMLGLRGQIGNRDLMRAECSFDGHAINGFRSCPSLGRAQYDHRPPRAHREAVGPGI